MEEYIARVKTVWESGQLTNNGQLVRELESRLTEYLGVKHVIPVSNGDAGLRIAIKALELTGEVITTPFSYVSTASTLLWSGLKPVFVDIEPKTLTIDADLIEAAITPETSAILATHVYGNPCDVKRIEEIAERHGLKVIYDAAHAFGVQTDGCGILEYGDLSMVSLHATKVYHSAEGGILATNATEHYEAAEWRRRFGHKGQEAFHGVGINAKMTELNAAMGLCVLDHIEHVLSERKRASETYDRLIAANDSVSLSRPTLRDGTLYNYAYYPVLFDSEAELLAAFASLESQNIFPRRYFYPSLNTISVLGKFAPAPVSEQIAPRVACLPLSAAITDEEIEMVVEGLTNNA